MKILFTLSVACLIAGGYCFAQVKSTYQYSTSMPYGTLDIRTRISSTNYYYLQENITFSFRESSPGVRTNTYADMTGWESNPYKQGNLRHRIDTKDQFVMNYRLLFPNGYNSTYADGYPLVVHLHGAVERANCYYQNCYHATPSYTVDANSPPAPKTATHRLLNNDHNLNVGGKQYLDARNLAGTRLPNDPSMPGRAFPGFVIVPQMFNIWDSLQVQDMVRIVRLVAAKYKINQDRIYVQGLSIGGYAVFEAMKRASWLFAAALPMSAVWDANIFKQNQQGRVAHMPVWIFQGGKDTYPTPSWTQNVISGLQKAGAVVRYSLYSDLGHVVWTRAYSQSDYFSWMLKQSKANIHPFAGNTIINKSKSLYPKLMLAEGFLAYQWEKDGVVISTAKANTYTATTPGTYRARFSRKSSYPTEAQWNKWSPAVKITEVTTTTAVASASSARTATSEEVAADPENLMAEEDFAFNVYPNPASADNINLQLQGMENLPVEVRIVDQLGRELYKNTFDSPSLSNGQQLTLPTPAKGGVYIVMIDQGGRQLRKKVVLKD
ncbi:MAG TPA: T9SS type A sorting domain-containing protein [Chryseosolibacter sp.]|nr:T9SS type A sorting domain-containing protein [Chryseosolibacter sp.]